MLRRIFDRRSRLRAGALTSGHSSAQQTAGVVPRIAVVDTETTGLYASDRIVEIAVVTVDRQGRVLDEWQSLVNPERDVGPTWLHGLTPSMLADAPRFADVAGPLAARLEGAVLAAHNLPFDIRMLSMEFDRLGLPSAWPTGLDTLAATKAKLAAACDRYGITLRTAHCAISDARAVAALLPLVIDIGTPCAPLAFNGRLPPAEPDRARPRDPRESHRTAPPSWISGVALSLQHEAEASLLSYLELLDRAMADLYLDGGERDALAELATGLGLSSDETKEAHRRWLDDFLRKAWEDGEVDESEYDELSRAASVLGLDQSYVDDRTAPYRMGDASVCLDGVRVCFTGEPVDASGRAISRAEMEAHARAIGLEPVDSVTKKRCDVLVASDPGTLSEKARKARAYGVPIVAASEFLAATAGELVGGTRTAVVLVDTALCQACGRPWTSRRGAKRSGVLCHTCASAPATAPAAGDVQVAFAQAPETAPIPVAVRVRADGLTVELFQCLVCGGEVEHRPGPGRKPKRCATCRGGRSAPARP